MKSYLPTAFCCLALMSSCGAGGPQIPPAEAILGGLHPGHPRLLAQSMDFSRLKSVCAEDAQARHWLAKPHTRGRSTPRVRSRSL
jgi:hypothetical protein